MRDGDHECGISYGHHRSGHFPVAAVEPFHEFGSCTSPLTRKHFVSKRRHAVPVLKNCLRIGRWRPASNLQDTCVRRIASGLINVGGTVRFRIRCIVRRPTAEKTLTAPMGRLQSPLGAAPAEVSAGQTMSAARFRSPSALTAFTLRGLPVLRRRRGHRCLTRGHGRLFRLRCSGTIFFIGAMAANQAADTCTKHCMMPGKMASCAAHCCASQATFGTCLARKERSSDADSEDDF